MKYEKLMSTKIVNCKTVAGSSVAELGLHSGNFGCQAAGCLAALCNVCAALGNVCAAPCNVCAALCNVCAALWGAQKRDGNDNFPTDGKERSASVIGNGGCSFLSLAHRWGQHGRKQYTHPGACSPMQVPLVHPIIFK